MVTIAMRKVLPGLFLLALFTSVVPPALQAQNQVLGELQLEGTKDEEKTAGVWIDGQYLGYVQELKGSKKILLLPGEHQVTVRQGGYLDFSQKISLQPGEKQLLRITLEKDTRVHLPTVTAEVKLAVTPDRAAVFVDGVFVGHIGEFNGAGKALLVAPGKHRIKISLPGYQTFETELNLTPYQKFQLKTDLAKGPVTESSTP
ncbi:MAG: PEGA domain-containing protein [Acidobacteria bacterium]|nr:PEGA domain-containing protein [Acidobacteriota bacterium]